MEGKINVLIVHFNTPLLTECLVKSINKHTPNCSIYIFDNSDKYPFTAKFDNVTIFDNTKGQYFNFDKWLEKYPHRFESGGRLNKWGSAKHCLSVDLCMSLIDGNFILVDSDVLVKRDISDLFLPQYAYVGEVVMQRWWNRYRLLPYICFINSNACKKHGIHYFDDNRIHGLKNEVKVKDAEKYDTGSSFYYDCENLPSKKIKIDPYVVHYSGGSWVKEKRLSYSIPFSPQQWVRKYAKLWATGEELEKMRNKKVVYTCITGNYEPLADPVVISDGFDYVCFTDSKDMKSDVWEFRPIPSELSGLTVVKQQRCVKICPHRYLPEYDLSIWVDGSVKLIGELNEFVKDKCGDSVISIPKHPKRTCIYKEEESVIAIKKDKKANTWPQMLRYKKEGFPANYGLVQSNIVIRKHNDEKCRAFMEDWASEVRRGSKRDQLSFDYVRWKHRDDVKVNMLDKDTCQSKYFKWDAYHGKKKTERITEADTIRDDLRIKRESAAKNLAKKIQERKAYKETIKSNPIAKKKAVSEKLSAFLRT